jgi:hypothetical protein
VRSFMRPLALVSLLLVMTLGLAGCVHLDRSVTLGTDGSGSYTLNMGISDQVMSLGSDQIAQPLNDFGAKVKQEGGTWRRFEDAGYTVWAFTWPFSSIHQLNQRLGELPDSGSALGGGQAPTPQTGDTFHVTEQSGLLSNSFHVTGHMSMKVPAGQDTGGVDVSQFFKDAHESFAITMPGWISSHTGGSVSGNTVTYTIHFNEEATIDVVGGGPNTGVLVPAGAGVVLLLIVAGVGIFLMARRRRRTSTEPAPLVGAPAAGGYPDAGTTLPGGDAGGGQMP